MYLESSEKLALLCLLLEIMNADGILSDNEKSYVSSVMRDYGLSNADIMSAHQMDPQYAVRIVYHMEDQKKALFYRIFQNMEHVDNSPFPQTVDVVDLITIKARLLESVKKCR